MSETNFNLGDQVNWNGVLGKVVDIVGGNTPVEVAFDNGNSGLFTLDGRYYPAMTEPSLKLVQRAPRKVKYYPALIGYKLRDNMQSTQLFSSLKDAQDYYNHLPVAITWPYIPGVTEIEE